MKLLRLAPLMLIAAFVLAFPAPARAQNYPPTKVAIANPAKVFQELQETKDLKVAMEAKQKTLQNQEFEKRQKLKDLQVARDQLKPDSPQYAQKNEELLQESIAFETWGRMQQMNLQGDQKRQMVSLFVKIRSSVQQVATQKGIDLVVAEQRPEFPENLDQLNVDQLRALINSQNILFSTPQIDISNDVIAAMDLAYKAGK